jgi:hypothetical protein
MKSFSNTINKMLKKVSLKTQKTNIQQSIVHFDDFTPRNQLIVDKELLNELQELVFELNLPNVEEMVVGKYYPKSFLELVSED